MASLRISCHVRINQMYQALVNFHVSFLGRGSDVNVSNTTISIFLHYKMTNFYYCSWVVIQHRIQLFINSARIVKDFPTPIKLLPSLLGISK